MALKAFDGFDHYNASADFVSRSNWLQWQINSTIAPTISFVTGLTGYGRALSLGTHETGGAIATWSAIRAVFGDRNTEAYFGFRMEGKPASGGNATGLWMVVGDSIAGTQQFTIHIDETNYAIEIYAGQPWTGSLGAPLWTSSNNVWIGGVGFFLEIHIKIATSGAGTVAFKVDNKSVGTASITTQQTANAWFDVIDFAASPISISDKTVFLDDFYYNDTTSGSGTFPMNSFAGDSRVVSLFATGNDVVQFTPLANTNWQEISEVAMDSDTSYNSDNTAGHQDTFVMQSLQATLSVIYGLQLTYATRNDGAGTRTIGGVVKIGGTSYVYGSPNNVPASSTYVYFSDLWILSPATGLNFTRTEINGADFGYNLVT